MYSEPRQAFAVPEINFPDFVKKMKSLIRRAAKLGVGEISYGECGEKFKPVYCQAEDCRGIGVGCRLCSYSGASSYKRSILVQVYGDKPVLPGGYELCARVEPFSAGVNLVHVVPGYSGAQIPEEYRSAQNRCDHCKTNRRRKDLYVVHGPDGFLLVGRNCLRDFTGVGQQDPEAVAKFAQYLFDAFGWDVDPDAWGSHDPAGDAWPIVAFLGQVAALIRLGGWISKGAAGYDDVPTADLACQAFTPPHRPRAGQIEEWAAWVESVKPSDDDKKEAKEAHEWVSAIDANNDYLYTIQALAAGEYAQRRHAGYIASIVSSYARQRDRLRHAELERERRARQGAEADDAGHFGEIGKRVEVEVELTESLRWFENNFGSSALHSLVTPDGHRLKWWASEGAARKADLKVGEKYRVKLTPKEHGDYRDVPETKVARLSVVAPCA